MPLRQLVPDPNNKSSSDNPKVDIIAVHGLNPRWKSDADHAWDTWRDPKGAQGRLWLRDDLPAEVPDSRIFLYEYNATVVYGKDRGTFVDKASELLEAIVVKRKSRTETRPIIFLCHSMGGLLVEQALINAHNNPNYTSIKNATSGLVFFATPQRGAEVMQVDLGRIASSIARKMKLQTGEGVMEALEHGNLFEDVLQEHRRHQLPDYDIVSFWGAFDDIVPRESSRLGLSGNNENVVKLDANHGRVCRFGTSQRCEDNLATVTYNISEVYAKALKKRDPRRRRVETDHLVQHYYIPLPRNRTFTGRSGQLEVLKRGLFPVDGTGYQKLSIFGLGGIGKTQLALKFAHWVKDNKSDFSVFWVPVLSRESFKHACSEIGKKVGFLKDVSNDNEDPREPFRNYLESADSGNWLLVVDNADDENIVLNSSGGIRNYLPNSDTGLTLFTTRTWDIGNALADYVIELPQMSHEEAIYMLQTSLRRKCHTKLAAELVQELTYLPLAIDQTAAFMNRNGLGVRRYLGLFRREDCLVDLMKGDLPDKNRYPESVNALATTWSISFKQIMDKDRAAALLMCFISFIEPKAIPRSLLPKFQGSEAAMESRIGTLSAYAFLTSSGEDEESENEAMNDEIVEEEDVEDEEMKDEGVYDAEICYESIQDENVEGIEMEDNTLYQDMMYDMHGLVHHATKEWIRITDRGMASILYQVEKAWVARSEYLWRLYLPHTLCVLKHSNRYKPHKAKYDLCFRVGKCLSIDHRFHEAIGYFEEVFKRERVAEKYSGLAPGDSLLCCLGVAYTAIGRADQAIDLLEAWQAIMYNHLDRNDCRVLQCEQALANAYLDVGRIAEAVRLLERNVKVLESRSPFGPDHPDRLKANFLLGRARLEQGQFVKAIKLLDQTVEIFNSVCFDDEYDEYDTDRLLAQHWLAMAYLRQGELLAALNTLQPVVDMHRRIHEREDPYRLLSEERLSELLMRTPMVEDAKQLRKHVADVKRELAGQYPLQSRDARFYRLDEFKAL